METDFSRLLEGINWDNILEGDKTTSPAAFPNSSSLPNEGSLSLAEGGMSVHAEEAMEGGGGGATRAGGMSTLLPPQPPPISQPQPQPHQQQQRATMQMGQTGGTYYVNATPYQTIGMAPTPGCGQVQTQPFVFAQPGGQMMYMPMPYFQHAAYQHSSAHQHMYPAPQTPYYHPHIVQMPSETPIMPSMPRNLQQQQQPQYRAPPQVHARGLVVNTQPHLQQQQQVEVSENDFGYVYLYPGTQLPQGVPFFPFGVRPTSHYAVPLRQGYMPNPPKYNGASFQQNRHVVCGNENNEEKESKSLENKTLASQMCDDLNFPFDNVICSYLQSKQEENLASPIIEHSTDNIGNATPAAAEEKDTTV